MISRFQSLGRSFAVLAPMLAAMAACFAAKEFYPLSSFPMYSKFDDRTYLVYLRSADGEALPTVPTVNMVSSQMKKRYGAELKELKTQYKGSHFDWSAERKRLAGDATLRYLAETFNPAAFEGGKLDGVRLIDVRVFLEDSKPITSEEEVGVWP